MSSVRSGVQGGATGILRRRFDGRQRALADLTPLVDITLMLVVFLLLTSQAVDRGLLPVDLPAATTADPEQPSTQQTMHIVVTAAGDVLSGQQQLTLQQLSQLAQGHQRAVIDADKQSPHGRVVTVVDVLRQAGLADIAYATADADGEALLDW